MGMVEGWEWTERRGSRRATVRSPGPGWYMVSGMGPERRYQCVRAAIRDAKRRVGA